MKTKECFNTVALIISILIFALVVYFKAGAEQPEPPELTIKPAVAEELAKASKAEVVTLPARIELPDQPVTISVLIVDETEEAETQEEPELPEEPQEPTVNENELEMLACAIYAEAGGNAAGDETRYMVGDVILNRIADDRWPDTMEAVLTQERQYGAWYWTGIKWPDRAQNPGEAAAVERAYDTAWALLTDEHHSELYGNGYIGEAEFPQGYDVIHADGLYFGK